MDWAQARPLLLRACAGLLAAAGVVLLGAGLSTWRLDAWIYDLLLPGVDQRSGDDIVMVVADDKSLSALGRWPWSRGVHAQLVERLSAAGVRGIAFDVMLSEPNRDDASGDAALVNALQRSGKVVLPVTAEASEPDGTPIEVLPMSSLIEAAAALGHAEIGLDPDGVARLAYLHAGLGSAHWPSLALALRNLQPSARDDGPLPGLRNREAETAPSPYLWKRDYRVLVPYVGASGFQQASYIDILEGRTPVELLRDRWVVVGVTASGVARDVLVPGVGSENRISGVEYHANLLNALLQDNAIVPFARAQQLGLGIALVLLPVVLHRPRSRYWLPWVATAASAAATLLACMLLLHFGRYWFAPAAPLLVLLAGYGIWLLLHLRRSQKLASSDGLTQLANRHTFDLILERELAAAKRSNRPLSLLLIDVDHFKPYNDHYGHQAGDAILRQVADTLMIWARRPRDLAARYGGDELALVLPESSANAAISIAQTLIEDVRALRIPHAVSDTAPHVTLSIGIATYYPILEGHDIDLLRRADTALYRAKREGRDRFHCASGSSPQD